MQCPKTPKSQHINYKDCFNTRDQKWKIKMMFFKCIFKVKILYFLLFWNKGKIPIMKLYLILKYKVFYCPRWVCVWSLVSYNLLKNFSCYALFSFYVAMPARNGTLNKSVLVLWVEKEYFKCVVTLFVKVHWSHLILAPLLNKHYWNEVTLNGDNIH